jgi:hypothetical protein
MHVFSPFSKQDRPIVSQLVGPVRFELLLGWISHRPPDRDPSVATKSKTRLPHNNRNQHYIRVARVKSQAIRNGWFPAAIPLIFIGVDHLHLNCPRKRP